MKTLEEYNEVAPNECPDCEGRLGPVQHYPHAGGWEVSGFKEKQWLYRHCRKCRYDWALWKLGVPREVTEQNREQKKEGV